MYYSNQETSPFKRPTAQFSYLATVNDILTRPTTGFEMAEAAFRVNVELRNYFKNPLDNTPLVRLPVGTRNNIKSQAESFEKPTDNTDPARALYLATCVAIWRGEAERLRPVRSDLFKPLQAYRPSA